VLLSRSGERKTKSASGVLLSPGDATAKSDSGVLLSPGDAMAKSDSGVLLSPRRVAFAPVDPHAFTPQSDRAVRLEGRPKHAPKRIRLFDRGNYFA